jgi:hypothetical protein
MIYSIFALFLSCVCSASEITFTYKNAKNEKVEIPANALWKPKVLNQIYTLADRNDFALNNFRQLVQKTNASEVESFWKNLFESKANVTIKKLFALFNIINVIGAQDLLIPSMQVVHRLVQRALAHYPLDSKTSFKKIPYDFEESGSVDKVNRIKIELWRYIGEYSDLRDANVPPYILFWRKPLDEGQQGDFCSSNGDCKSVHTTWGDVLDLSMHPTENFYIVADSKGFITLHTPFEKESILQFTSKLIEGKRFANIPIHTDGAVIFNETGTGGYWGFGNVLYTFSYDISRVSEVYNQKKIEEIKKLANDKNIRLKSEKMPGIEEEFVSQMNNNLTFKMFKGEMTSPKFLEEQQRISEEVKALGRINIKESEQDKKFGFEAQELAVIEDKNFVITNLSLYKNMLVIEGLSGSQDYAVRFFDTQIKQFIEKPREAFDVLYADAKKQTLLLGVADFISAYDITTARKLDKASDFRAMMIDMKNNKIVVCKKDPEVITQSRKNELSGEFYEEPVNIPAIYYGEFIPEKIKAAIGLLNKQTTFNISTVYDALFVLSAVEADFNMSKIPAYITNKASASMKSSLFSWWSRAYTNAYNWYASLNKTTQSRLKWLTGAGIAAGFAGLLYSQRGSVAYSKLPVTKGAQ